MREKHINTILEKMAVLMLRKIWLKAWVLLKIFF